MYDLLDFRASIVVDGEPGAAFALLGGREVVATGVLGDDGRATIEFSVALDVWLLTTYTAVYLAE